jgi:FkbM family methyltransferase
MSKPLRTTIFNLLPGWLLRPFLSTQTTRGWLYSMVRQQDVTIPMGAGKGLLFNNGYSNPAYALGSNEPPVQHAIEQNLKAGDIFYDIGTNVGFFTVIAARKVGRTGHVYSFEPLPDNVKAIQHNIDLNGFKNTTILAKAVAERSGTGELLVAGYSGGSALSTANMPPPDMTGTMAVDIVSIDALIEAGTIRPPSLVKVDVEGAELGVFKGMTETMKRHQPKIIYEIDDGRRDEYEKKAAECQTFLEAHDYVVQPLETAYTDIQWIVGHYVATFSGSTS